MSNSSSFVNTFQTYTYEGVEAKRIFKKEWALFLEHRPEHRLDGKSVLNQKCFPLLIWYKVADWLDLL